MPSASLSLFDPTNHTQFIQAIPATILDPVDGSTIFSGTLDGSGILYLSNIRYDIQYVINVASSVYFDPHFVVDEDANFSIVNFVLKPISSGGGGGTVTNTSVVSFNTTLTNSYIVPNSNNTLRIIHLADYTNFNVIGQYLQFIDDANQNSIVVQISQVDRNGSAITDLQVVTIDLLNGPQGYGCNIGTHFNAGVVVTIGAPYTTPAHITPQLYYPGDLEVIGSSSVNANSGQTFISGTNVPNQTYSVSTMSWGPASATNRLLIPFSTTINGQLQDFTVDLPVSGTNYTTFTASIVGATSQDSLGTPDLANVIASNLFFTSQTNTGYLNQVLGNYEILTGVNFPGTANLVAEHIYYLVLPNVPPSSSNFVGTWGGTSVYKDNLPNAHPLTYFYTDGNNVLVNGFGNYYNGETGYDNFKIVNSVQNSFTFILRPDQQFGNRIIRLYFASGYTYDIDTNTNTALVSYFLIYNFKVTNDGILYNLYIDPASVSMLIASGLTGVQVVVKQSNNSNYGISESSTRVVPISSPNGFH